VNLVLETVPISALQPSRYQARARFEEKEIEALSESIKVHGLLEPIIVRQMGDSYEVIAGERRVRAATRAGSVLIAAMVIKANDQQAAALSLVENLHRVNLDPIEKAMAFKRMTEEPLKMSHDEIARLVGSSRPMISKLISHLDEPAIVKSHLSTGKLTGRHVRELKPVADIEQKSELANQAVEHGWTSRELGKRVSELLAGPSIATSAPGPQPGLALKPAQPRPTSLWRGLMLILAGSTASWAAGFVPWNSFSSLIRALGQVGWAIGVLSVLRNLYALRERWLSELTKAIALASLTQNLRHLIQWAKAVGGLPLRPEKPDAPKMLAENKAPTAQGEARHATGAGIKALCLALVVAGAALSAAWLAHQGVFKKEHPLAPPDPGSLPAEPPGPYSDLDQYTPAPKAIKGGEQAEKARPQERIRSSPVAPSGNLRRHRRIGGEPGSSSAPQNRPATDEPQTEIPAGRPPGVGGRIVQQ
jgi:ParB family chromosome partitioning protein